MVSFCCCFFNFYIIFNAIHCMKLQLFVFQHFVFFAESFITAFDRMPNYRLLVNLFVANRIMVIGSRIATVSGYYHQFSAEELQYMWFNSAKIIILLTHTNQLVHEITFLICFSHVKVNKTWNQIKFRIFWSNFLFERTFILNKYTIIITYFIWFWHTHTNIHPLKSIQFIKFHFILDGSWIFLLRFFEQNAFGIKRKNSDFQFSSFILIL